MATIVTPVSNTAKTYGVSPAVAAKVDAAAQDFEAVFVTQMIQQMFTGMGEDGPLGDGEAGSAYRSMLTDEYGKTIASAGGIGVADQVRRELIALQQGH
jgi:Rod binding domain-containing protein